MYKYNKVKKKLLGGKGDIFAEQVVTSKGVEEYHEEPDVLYISYPLEMIFNMTAIELNRN